MSQTPASKNDVYTVVHASSESVSESISKTQNISEGSLTSVLASTSVAPPGFTIERELGRGGMGVVYLAHQHGLNRAVALKLMLADDSKSIIRFLAESELVASVRHANVVEVYQFGEHEGRPFLALEYLQGGSLADHLRHRSPPNSEDLTTIAELTARIADGVQAAHALGIVHRDLKPHNVLFAEPPLTGGVPVPKVVDFGLAKRGVGSELTRTTTVMGTPAYMPPEQAKGETKFVGPQADVWSLGVILYELLTGVRPFHGNDSWQTIAAVIRGDFPKPKRLNPAVSRDLELICLKCLQPLAADRYQSAGELSDDLRRWLAGKPITARPAGWIETTSKAIRRNKTLASAAFITAMALFIGSIISFWQANRATQEANNAKEATQVAERKTIEAKDSAEKFRIASVQAHDQLIRAHLSTTRIYLDRNDYSTSLHWIAKAWLDDEAALEPGKRLDPQREANHRLRLGDGLEKFAKPIALCQHDSGVLEAEVTPNGERIITLAEDGLIRVWRSDLGELAYPTLTPNAKAASIALSPNGERLAIAIDRSIRVHELMSGELIHELKHDAPVLRVAYSTDGKRLASASGQAIRQWNEEGTDAMPRIEVGEAVDYIAYSPDGDKLVTSGPGERAFVWNATTGEKLSKALPQTRPKVPSGGDIDHLPFLRRKHPVFDAEGKRLLTTDNIGCWMWSEDEKGGKQFVLFRSSSALTEAHFIAGKSAFAAVMRSNSTPNNIFRVDFVAGKIITEQGGYPRQPAGLRLSKDGRLSAVPISAGKLFVRNLDGGKDICEPIVCTKPVTAFRYVQPGNRLLVASMDGSVRLFELPSERTEQSKYNLDCGRADLLFVQSRVFSPDGKLSATINNGGVELKARLADVKPIILTHPDARFAIFDPTGTAIATASFSSVKLWRVTDGSLLHTFGFMTLRRPSNLAQLLWTWSLDGQRFAIVAQPGLLNVWDLTTKTTKLVVKVPHQFPFGVSLSGRGEYVAVSGYLDRVSRWKVDTAQMLPEVNLVKDAIMTDIHLGRDGRLLTIASDLTVRQFKADGSGPSGPTIRLPSAPYDAAYSPDQRRIAVIYNYMAQVFDADSGELLASKIFYDAPGNLRVWWDTKGERVIAHYPNSGYVRSWKLQAFAGDIRNVPTMVSLATGARFDAVEGITPIDVDDYRKRSVAYRTAQRSWNGR